jgi:hypothetical protein
MMARVLFVAVLCAAAVMSNSGQAKAADPFGLNYGVAAAQGAAFPGAKAFWAGACDLRAASTGSGGVGAAPSAPIHCIDEGAAQPCDLSPSSPTHCSLADPRWARTWVFGEEPAWRLNPFVQAGGRPDATTTFWMKRAPAPNPTWGAAQPDGDTKTVIVRLPPGVIGNPNAVPRCESRHLTTTPNTCPPETQVGVSSVVLGQITGIEATLHPVYNVEPRRGKTAELLLSPATSKANGANIPIVAKARTGEDFGVDAVALNVPGGVPLLGQTLTLWGVPWAASHDVYRAPAGYMGSGSGGGMPFTGLAGGTPEQEPQPYDVDWGPIKPFFTNPTECSPVVPETSIQLDSWQNPGVFKGVTAPADAAVEGCAAVPFDSDLAMSPSTTVADAPTGLTADLVIPQNEDAPLPLAEDPDDDAGAPAYWRSQDGLATAQLDKAVVTLPDGFTVNPAGAAGLRGCSDAQLGVLQDGNPPRFNEEDPFDGKGAECPDGSKIGTAKVFTPLLPGADDDGTPNLTGDVVLGVPRSTDPESGAMFRLFVVMRNAERGLVAKIAGSAVADRDTGQLTATFDKNPRVPFETLRLEMKGGQRGTLATSQRCAGDHGWSSTLSPWSAAHGAGGQVDPHGGTFVTASRCGFGFAPKLQAGMSSQQGGASGRFSFRFSREDGEQWLHSVTAALPAGLLATVKDVPLCSSAAAAAGACPAASRIGTVDAGAGSGLPYFLEKKGSAYLTEGYKGAPYGLATVVPVEAGPFTGQFALDPIVVRQALHVDRRTARVTAVSDPFPQIWHGIPLRARQVTVTIDRAGFMRNPTDCTAKRIEATIASRRVTAARAVPFQVANCRALAFEPRIAMRLSGRRQTKTHGHPGLRADVVQRGGEAGIRRAEVRLPRALALDPDNARDLCEFEDGTKPDLERHCSKASIVGRARAVSPLLKAPLVGNVYFVKNVRIDPTTGQPRRTLPMIVVALRGEIAVNLRGESDVKGGRLINTFSEVPDAPISRFALTIDGGRRGILVVTDSSRGPLTICGRQIAETAFDGHNGRTHDRDIRVKTPCGKRKGKRVVKRKATSGSRRR